MIDTLGFYIKRTGWAITVLPGKARGDFYRFPTFTLNIATFRVYCGKRDKNVHKVLIAFIAAHFSLTLLSWKRAFTVIWTCPIPYNLPSAQSPQCHEYYQTALYNLAFVKVH